MEHWGAESRLKFVRSWFGLLSPKVHWEIDQGELSTVERIRYFGARQDWAQILALPAMRFETWDKSVLFSESLFLSLESGVIIISAYWTIVRLERLYRKFLGWFLAQPRRWIQLSFSPGGVGMPPKENAAEITDACAKHSANNFSSTFRPVVKSFLKVDYFVLLA